MSELGPDDWNALGQLVDRLDNNLAGTVLPLPPKMVLDAITANVAEVRDELRAFVIEKSGENPWEFHP